MVRKSFTEMLRSGPAAVVDGTGTRLVSHHQSEFLVYFLALGLPTF